MRHAPLVIGLATAAAVLVADQVTKQLVLDYFLTPPEGAPVTLTGFLNLVLVWNRGVSFGMLGGESTVPAWGLGLVAIAIVVALLVWMVRSRSRGLGVALGLIVGGAIGNVVDRLIHGAVVDFIDFHYGDWHWPAFNIADSGITVGVAWLFVDSLFGSTAPERVTEKE
ncbi:MAG: signal peptidase II [Rhodospirillaceae bacterium]|nr:signal peptidase II [Rhodospirillaceae bacterium]